MMVDNQQRRFSDLDSCWSWAVMWACFISLFVIGGSNYSIGLVHNILLQKYNDSQTNTALVGALHTSVSNLVAPLSSILIDKFSVRVALISCGLLYTIGFVSTAFASSLQVSVFTIGVIAGLGGATGWTASMVAPSFHFKKYLSIAQGISMAGNGAGMFGIPPILSWASGSYGSFGFFIALGCISIQCVVCGMITRPSMLERHLRGERKTKLASGKGDGMMKTYLQVVTTKSIVLYILSMFFYGYGMYIVFVYLPNYCIREGVSEMQASMVISVCGIAAIFGRILVGFVASFKSVSEILLYSGSLFMMSLTTSFLPLYGGNIHGQFVYAAILGLLFGCPYVTIAPIGVMFLGVGRLAAALGLILSGCGLGGIIGPITAGMLMDSTGSFDHVFVLAGVMIGVSSLFGYIPYFFEKLNEESEMTETVDASKDNGNQTEKMLITNDAVT